MDVSRHSPRTPDVRSTGWVRGMSGIRPAMTHGFVPSVAVHPSVHPLPRDQSGSGWTERFLAVLDGHSAAVNNGVTRLNVSIPRRPATSEPAHRSLSRSEEHTSELQSLMRLSYARFCL